MTNNDLFQIKDAYLKIKGAEMPFSASVTVARNIIEIDKALAPIMAVIKDFQEKMAAYPENKEMPEKFNAQLDDEGRKSADKVDLKVLDSSVIEGAKVKTEDIFPLVFHGLLT